MREQARLQALEEKNYLKDTFSSQYNDKLNSKAEAERREKEKSEQEMNRIVKRN